MSNYNGFTTRALESHYNRTLCQMFRVLSSFTLSTIKQEHIEMDAFIHTFFRTFKLLARLEDQKQTLPRFSDYCQDLAGECNTHSSIIEEETVPELTNDVEHSLQQ